MPEERHCNRLDRWLESGAKPESPAWLDHLDACESCSEQWHAHRLLAVGLARDAVPELSAGFQARLERKLSALPEIRPLRGWRRAAMIAYAFVAVGLLSWALVGVSLPEIDLSAPWVPLTSFFAVPLSLVFAIAASRWIPARGASWGPRALAI